MVKIVNLIKSLNDKGIYLFSEDDKLKTKAAKGVITPDIATTIRDHKTELLDYLKKNAVDTAITTTSSSPITPVSREQDLPLSFAQQRLWLLDKIDGGSLHYNMPGALRLTGELDRDALSRAVNTIVARHESLRTCFIEGADGQPLQAIQAFSTFEVPLVDLSMLPSNERNDELKKRISAEANTAFDLSRDMMLRAQLMKVSDLEHVLLVTMHPVSYTHLTLPTILLV